ncbi:response regulator [Lichenifustis flavocetrariae]|uniref:Response regulator n=1 Tax=Lichenifustis flavocetrariae TaxID=2949735 RepID=A0AA41YRN3_9HYPH|nr:response regulator [Lichenifustis flavocetrariae]MCW6506924.1 response regulator [Lichenifustis flavocetrariae]
MGRRHTPLRFLVVEDEALLAMDLGMMIEDAGHHVVAEAGCLREVQGLDVGIAPDVAFVDLHLAEGSSGLDVCAHIKQNWGDAIIVFVTANPRKLRVDHPGAHGVIAKPFSRNGIMSALRYITEGICDPPPSASTPPDFTAFPALAATWKD